MLAFRGRIASSVPIEDWFAEAERERRFETVPLRPRIAITSTRLGASVPRDPADRLIIASALDLQVPLVTRDAAIAAAAVPGLRVIW